MGIEMNNTLTPEASVVVRSKHQASRSRRQLPRFSCSWLTPADGHGHIAECGVLLRGDNLVLQMRLPGVRSLEEVALKVGTHDNVRDPYRLTFDGDLVEVTFNNAAGRRELDRGPRPPM